MKNVVYKPSVCHQTGDSHIHYDIILVTPPLADSTNEDILRRLANKVGGSTAGQLVSLLLEQPPTDLHMYGIDYIKIETLPIYQICHKGEIESPAVDWDAFLFVPVQNVAPVPPAHVQVAHIRHS